MKTFEENINLLFSNWKIDIQHKKISCKPIIDFNFKQKDGEDNGKYRTRMSENLRKWLYDYFYVRPAKEHQYEGSLIDLYDTINAEANNHTIQEYWRVTKVSEDKTIRANKFHHETEFNFQQYIPPKPIFVINDFVRSIHINSSVTDFYFFIGYFAPNDTDESVRFYFNILPDDDLILQDFLFTLIHGLNSKKASFTLKILHEKKHFVRADACVLYLNKQHYFIAIDVIKECYNIIKQSLRQDTPLFTYKIMDGLGFAEEPADRSFKNRFSNISFGQSRMHEVANGIMSVVLDPKYIALESDELIEKIRTKLLRKKKSKFSLEDFHLNNPSGVLIKHPTLDFGYLEKKQKTYQNQIFLNAAITIANELCKYAIWNNQQCVWLSMIDEQTDKSIYDRKTSIQPCKLDFWDGTLGIGFFLLQINKIFANPIFVITALGAFKNTYEKAIIANDTYEYYSEILFVFSKSLKENKELTTIKYWANNLINKILEDKNLESSIANIELLTTIYFDCYTLIKDKASDINKKISELYIAITPEGSLPGLEFIHYVTQLEKNNGATEISDTVNKKNMYRQLSKDILLKEFKQLSITDLDNKAKIEELLLASLRFSKYFLASIETIEANKEDIKEIKEKIRFLLNFVNTKMISNTQSGSKIYTLKNGLLERINFLMVAKLISNNHWLAFKIEKTDFEKIGIEIINNYLSKEQYPPMGFEDYTNFNLSNGISGLGYLFLQLHNPQHFKPLSILQYE
ncbi:hypothetical protein GCM10027035_38860 [Emticicia sediminis]